MTLVIRSSMWNGQIMDRLRGKIGSIPGNGPASPLITPLNTRLMESGFAPLRIASLIFGTSTLTAFVLSIFGLLSVQSDTERQRRTGTGCSNRARSATPAYFLYGAQSDRSTRVRRRPDRLTCLWSRPSSVQRRTVKHRFAAISRVAPRADSVRADFDHDRNCCCISSPVWRTSEFNARQWMNYWKLLHAGNMSTLSGVAYLTAQNPPSR